MYRDPAPTLTPPRVGVALALFTFVAGLLLSIHSWYNVQTSEQILFVEAPFLLMVATAAGGIALIGRGWPRREGSRLHCAKCGHPWSAEIDRLHSQCQECGNPWRHYGGRVEGRPVRSRWLVGAGIALILLALTPPVVRSLAPGWVAASRSTQSLVRRATGVSWGIARDDWDALMLRSLSSAEVRQLCTLLLDKRLRDGSLPEPQSRWFQSQYASGVLTKDLVDRWLTEMFSVELDCPGAVTLGASVKVVARARFLGPNTDMVHPAGVFVEGLTVEGVPGIVGRERSVRPAERFSNGATLFEETVRADSAGTMRVRLIGWFVLGKMSDTIDYDSDGTPKLWGQFYARRFLLEKDIEVGAGRQ